MSRRRVRLRAVIALLGTALLLAGCASHAPQDSLKPEGSAAHSIMNLMLPVFIIAGIIFLIVLPGTLFIGLKFRAKDREHWESEDDMPPQVHGNFKIELGWTLAPALILTVVGAFTVVTVFNLSKMPPKQNLHVEVDAQQWWWQFKYDTNHDGKYDNIITADELVIPAKEKVALHLHSNDVIHGFWVPRLNGKKDVVPGHPNDFWIEADKPGTYFGQCTVFCGLSHANMRLKVVALSPTDYRAWEQHNQEPAKPPTSALAKAGLDVYKNRCTGCHEINGVNKTNGKVDELSGVAPDLTHLMNRTIFASGDLDLRLNTPECAAQGINYAIPACVDEADLRRWLQNPPGVLPMAPDGNGHPGTRRGMPNLNLSQTEIDQLVAYLETLR